MTMKWKICVLGTGNMGEALIKGMLSGGLYTRKEIIASDISEERLAHIHAVCGIKTTRDNAAASASSKFIMIAVKPAGVKALMEEISPALDRSKVIISIAAGVPIDRIRHWLKRDIPTVRVMPNIAILSMEGATAIAPGPGVTGRDREAVKKIFDSVGKSVLLGAEHRKVHTRLCGSGPAHIFTGIEG